MSLVSWLMTVYQLTESTNRCSTKIYRHKLLMPTITHFGSQPCQQSVFGRLLQQKRRSSVIPCVQPWTRYSPKWSHGGSRAGSESWATTQQDASLEGLVIYRCNVFAIVSEGRRFLTRTCPIVLLAHRRQTPAPAGLLRPSAHMCSTISFLHLSSESLPLLCRWFRPCQHQILQLFSFFFFFFFLQVQVWHFFLWLSFDL